ncbi:MAG: hypothetical protein MK135_10475 [Polyangiaceae bacterium]|nr:hypothetical protein [Polyangiaceae bacterium]
MFKIGMLPRKFSAAQRDLKHSQERVRLEAIADLARSSDGEKAAAREALAGVLLDPVAQVRAKALVALADLGRSDRLEDGFLSILNAVKSSLTDPSEMVRQMACLAIGELGQPEDTALTSALRPFLRATDPGLRFQSLNAFTRLRGQGWAGELALALQDRDPYVCRIALRLLDEVAVEHGAQCRQESSLEAHLRALLSADDLLNSALAEIALFDLGYDVKLRATLRVLGRKLRGAEPVDVQAAIETVAFAGETLALPLLRRRAFGLFGISWDPFRWLAIAALARLDDPQGQEVLAKGLRNPKETERFAALQALITIRLASMEPEVKLAREEGHSFPDELLKMLAESAGFSS